MITFNFDKHQQHATAFIHEVANELNTDDLDKAGRILITVLHTLRDRILPQESLDLIAQLPVYIRAAYTDGWRLSDKVERSHTREGFFNNVKKHAVAGINTTDFDDDEDVEAKVRAVFRVLERHVPEGEVAHLKSQLPEPIAELLEA